MRSLCVRHNSSKKSDNSGDGERGKLIPHPYFWRNHAAAATWTDTRLEGSIDVLHQNVNTISSESSEPSSDWNSVSGL